MSDSAGNSYLYCFVFHIDSITTSGGDTSEGRHVEEVQFKFAEYEWISIRQEEWFNVGRRCYLISSGDFMEKITESKLRVSVKCRDGSVHACKLDLGMLTIHRGVAKCRGELRMYDQYDRLPSRLQMRVALRVFNVDNDDHLPMPVHQSLLSLERCTQTADVGARRQSTATQTHKSLRNAAVQTKVKRWCNVGTQVRPRRVVTQAVGVQCSGPCHGEQLQRALEKVLAKTIANKAVQRQNQQRTPHSGGVLKPPSVAATSGFAFRRRRDLMSSLATTTITTNNRLKRKARWSPRRCRRDLSLIAAAPPRAAAVTGFNVIGRSELLRTLDRVIQQQQTCIEQYARSGAHGSFVRPCKTPQPPTTNVDSRQSITKTSVNDKSKYGRQENRIQNKEKIKEKDLKKVVVTSPNSATQAVLPGTSGISTAEKSLSRSAQRRNEAKSDSERSSTSSTSSDSNSNSSSQRRTSEGSEQLKQKDDTIEDTSSELSTLSESTTDNT